MAKVRSPKSKRLALQRAFALLRKGWVRGTSKKKRGDRVLFCLTGAVDEAALNGARDEAIVALYEALPFPAKDVNEAYLRKVWGTIPESVVQARLLSRKRTAIQNYNDRPATGKKDVMDVLRRALQS